jgi:hypothetical protein
MAAFDNEGDPCLMDGLADANIAQDPVEDHVETERGGRDGSLSAAFVSTLPVGVFDRRHAHTHHDRRVADLTQLRDKGLLFDRRPTAKVAVSAVKVFRVQKVNLVLRENGLDPCFKGLPIHVASDVTGDGGNVALWVFPAVVEITDEHVVPRGLSLTRRPRITWLFSRVPFVRLAPSSLIRRPFVARVQQGRGGCRNFSIAFGFARFGERDHFEIFRPMA